MSKAILGRKLGMTQIFTEEGKVVPVTVVESGNNIVIQNKTGENDGYNYTVDPGIHTWDAKSQGAEKYVSWLKEKLARHSYGYPYCCATPVILECEIPAGTKYYSGIAWADDKVKCAGYASEKVKVIKEREI